MRTCLASNQRSEERIRNCGCGSPRLPKKKVCDLCFKGEKETRKAVVRLLKSVKVEPWDKKRRNEI